MRGREKQGWDVDDGVTIGYDHDPEASPPEIGEGAVVRAGTVIYRDVSIGDGFSTGHNVLIRERTNIGDEVLVGTNSVIDGHTEVGSHVNIQTGVYVPAHTSISDNVFLGPHAVLTNDPYPIREETDLAGPTIEAGASIGANATVLPEITIGENAFVAAGAVVDEDLPAGTLAAGVPAEHRSLPEELQGGNRIDR